MKARLFLFLFFSFLYFAHAQTIDDFKASLQKIEPDLNQLLADHYAAGFAVAVIKDGQTIYSKGFGFRDYEHKLPVDEHTVFGIGSCTKSFTSAVLGQISSEGKLSLDDKPSKYLPKLKFHTDAQNDSIKIINLLSHSTGINSWPSESTAILFITEDKYEVIPRISYLKPSAPIGKSFIYNNLMYTIAGMVAEQASGKSLETNWEERIFKPLGMTNSYSNVAKAMKNANFSHGYIVDSISPLRVLQENMATRGAGGSIYSSVSDMSKWMQLWLDNGALNGTQVLSKNYVKTATSLLNRIPNHPSDTISPTARFYGLGWGNSNHKGFLRTEHAGGTSGYVSNMVLYHDLKLGIVVLSNQTTTSLPTMVTDKIIETLYPELKEDEPSINFGRKIPTTDINTPTIPDTIVAPNYALQKLEGTFHHPGFGNVEISLDDKTLFAKFPLTTFRLEYIGNDTFIDYNTEEIPYTYWNFLEFKVKPDDMQNIDAIDINIDQGDVSFERTK